MRELSLHILDVAENSISAGASRIKLNVTEALRRDQLWLSIQDNGRGMDAEQVRSVTDPFTTSRTTRKVGLGIPLLKAAAEACDGGLQIRSKAGKGTAVIVSFRHSHIDRMPLGDLGSTFTTLLLGSPEVNWVFRYQVDDNIFCLDDTLIKQELDGVSVTEPSLATWIRQYIETGIESTRTQPSLEGEH